MTEETNTQDERLTRLEEILDGLPARPGVYLMKDAEGRVIYVGKAVNLRSRVRSYFRDSGGERFSVLHLRGRVADIETVMTDTDKEAVLLENLLIKKHQPRYNIRLRDDKTYISLRLDTTHEWPRLHRVRKRRAGDKAHYFGPFASSGAVKETMRFLQKLFPLRSCPDSVLRNRSRPCILYQIDRCCAPCVDKVDPEKYRKYVDQTVRFLKGRREEVLGILHERMWAFSEQMAYEKAAEVRDRIAAIEQTIEKEKVASHRRFDRDVIGLARERGRMVVMVLSFRQGNLDSTDAFDFRDLGLEEGEILDTFLGQYYTEERSVPRDVLMTAQPVHAETIRRFLEEARGGPVRLAVPLRGEKARLLEMACRNAMQELEKRLAGEKSREQVLADLQRKLHLPALPRRIECFDISTFQGSFTVGSMTCFVDGEAERSAYRHFKVRSVEGQNDFAAMREVLSRRYARVLKEGSELPDLVVIDGGKGQLAMASKAMEEVGVAGRIPVCGLAKARLREAKPGKGTKSRVGERVFLPGRKNPVTFDQSDPALFVLTRIRDEAHRFGVAYHRKLRTTASLRTGLEEIPGVGPRRRRAMLSHFGSLARLRAASEEDMAALPGITPALARTIYQFLHGGDDEQPSVRIDTDPDAADEEFLDTDPDDEVAEE